ncbi:hypothetical protein [Streptomyces sp. RTd22]|uniref:hypothetical protein n=1 Tax=Streptomyces sp. RTd22 TaxID=1841249 RepID=UPI0007C444C5|nr:hypothetical protein [Streptomyces sp. RTd22]
MQTTATLVIGAFSSYCDGCKVGAFAQDTHHQRASGGSRDQPCGARFTAVRAAPGVPHDLVRDTRPDLPFTR